MNPGPTLFYVHSLRRPQPIRAVGSQTGHHIPKKQAYPKQAGVSSTLLAMTSLGSDAALAA